MNITVIAATLGGIDLKAGDEIAVFDGSICCGKSILTAPIDINSKITFAAIAASKEDDGLSNGYIVGNPISYKFWDSINNKEISWISAEYLDPDDGSTIAAPTFSINGSAFVKLSVPANQTPAANAGPDQSVNEGDEVILDGSASSDSDSDPITYKWTAPSGITLSSDTEQKPTFPAPEIVTDSQFTFSLVVNDGQADSAPDEVVITVLQVNKVPTANAGSDQSVNEGATTSLDGSASSDPDGDALTYKWTAPAGIVLSSDSDEKPYFNAPEIVTDSQYTFSLVVNDGFAESLPDDVLVTVLQVNKVPTANAGADHSVNESATATLDGSASSDPDGDVLTYKWTASPGITLSSDTDAQPTFTAPEVSADTQYTFTLVVNDGQADSPADEIVVTVRNVDHAPYMKDPIKNVSVNKGAPDQIIDLKTIFADDDPGDVLIFNVTSNTNDQVVTATITDSDLTLDFSGVNIGSSEIVITASSNGKEVNSKFEVEVKIPTGTNPIIIEQKLIVYPNPSSGKIKVVFEQIPKSNTDLTISNVNGIIVYKKTVQNKEESIDLTRNPPGIYLIKTNSDNLKAHKINIQ